MLSSSHPKIGQPRIIGVSPATHAPATSARKLRNTRGLALADLIVTHLLPVGSPLTVAVDDTLFTRSGRHPQASVCARSLSGVADLPQHRRQVLLRCPGVWVVGAQDSSSVGQGFLVEDAGLLVVA